MGLPSRRNLLKILSLIILLALILAVTYRYRTHLDLISLQQKISSYGILAPIIFILIYAIAAVLFLPGLIFTLTGGLLFGAIFGTLYNLIGATLGATCAFLVARYIASDWVATMTRGKLKLLIEGVARQGWRFIALVRLVPIFPFNLLNYALGLTKINVFEYSIASAIFMLPATFAYTYLGSLGIDVIYGGGKQLVYKILLAFGLLVLVGLIPIIIRRMRKNHVQP